jgi:glycosyltransferase involved in cell wall biosynthesis
VTPRVLHVVESLDRGAVENWLLRMLRHGRRKGVALDWTFYCTLERPGERDADALEMGAKVLHSPAPIGRTLRFGRHLRTELRRGHYDVLHCHHDLLSAVYLLASLGIPMRRRIVHAHNADEALPTPSRAKQKLYREPMRRICLGLADRIVGISDNTLDTFLAGRTRDPERHVVHYYGLDPSPFQTAKADRLGFRRELRLREDAFIMLFAGRMAPEKNPAFAVEVLAELRKLVPHAVAVFAGAGAEEAAVAAKVRELGIEPAVRFLGWRTDLAEVMSCCDCFILPRPERPLEGFGLAVVEAQLAGMRLLLSRGIADDPMLPGACYERLALSEGPAAWAAAASRLSRREPLARAAAAAALEASPMDLDFALRHLLQLHGQEIGDAPPAHREPCLTGRVGP